mgnify:CR=1 FL=1
MHLIREFGQSNSQITRSRCHIKHLLRIVGTQLAHRSSAPQMVDAEREQMVQAVITRGDAIEHRSHLTLLRFFVIVWFHIFIGNVLLYRVL